MPIGLILITSMLSVFAFHFLAQYFPHYYTWDMELVINLDMLQIQSGEHPIHLNHTGYGMYLILNFTQSILKYLGLLSATSFTDYSTSLNPLLLMAEQTYVLRLHNLFLIWGIIIVLYKSFLNLNPKISKLLNYLLFLFLCSVPSFWQYNAYISRTELYTLFFWSIAFYYITKPYLDKCRALYLFLSGLFIGLSYITKIQGILVCAILPLLYLLVNSKPWTFKWLKVSSWISCLFFGFYGVLALIVPINTDDYIIFGYLRNYSEYIFALGLYIAILTALIHYPKAARRFSSELTTFSLITNGFFVSWLGHFLFYADIKKSFLYLIYNYKVVFFRYSHLQRPQIGLAGLIDAIKYNLFHHGVLLLVHLALAAITWLKFKKEKDYKKLILVVCIEGLLLINLLLGVRAGLQDEIWVHISIGAFTILYLLSFWPPKFTKLASALMALLVSVQIYTLTNNFYNPLPFVTGYFETKPWQKDVYSTDRNQYSRLILKKLPNEDALARAQSQANNFDKISAILKNVFQNTTPTLRNVGFLNTEQSISGQEMIKVVSGAEPFKNYFIVDHSSLHAPNNKMNLFFRQDLEHIIFVPEQTQFELKGCTSEPVTHSVLFRYKSQNINYKAYRILNIEPSTIHPFGHCVFSLAQQYPLSSFSLIATINVDKH